MITIAMNGGLGNQLFQVFAALAAAVRNGDTCYFLYTVRDATGKRGTYWHTLFHALRPLTVIATQANVVRFMQLPTYQEPGFNYTPLPRQTTMNSTPLKLAGYFQSDKYFADVRDDVYEKLQLLEQQRRVREMFKESAWFSCDAAATVAMHFRIGDYKAISDKHPILTLEYYRRALNHVIQHAVTKDAHHGKINVLIFNQECDNAVVLDHMQQLSTSAEFAHRCRFHKVPDMFDEWKQLLLMSVCDNNIIANSTFSWWGAYLNQNPDKVVCYPSTWFGPALKKHDTRDLFPDGWVQVNSLLPPCPCPY
jgi:hypothetical protein